MLPGSLPGPSLKRILSPLLVTLLLSLPALAADPDSHRRVPRGHSSAAVAASNADAPVRQLIVKFRDEAPLARPDRGLAELSRAAGQSLAYGRAMAGGAHVLRLPAQMPLEQARRVAERLATLPNVRYAVPDQVKRIAAVPSDTRYHEQWHYRGPAQGVTGGGNFQAAWDRRKGDNRLVVAVLDTGVLAHADLDSNLSDAAGRVAPGFDFISDPLTAGDGNGRDANPTDPGDSCDGSTSSWHGTHVAGTIAASTDNGNGVAGATWSGRVMPLRVLGRCGGVDSDIIDAIYWAAGYPVPGLRNNTTAVQVINMSLGGLGDCTMPTSDAINAAVSRNISVVVAAGNDAAQAGAYAPANCANTITVHAHDINGQYAVYSNFGAVDLSAPGGDFSIDPGVLSLGDSGTTSALRDNAYTYYQGTSMATPHVAAAVLLMLHKNVTLTPAQILALLQSSARPFPQHGDAFDCNTIDCGAGLLDARAALNAIASGVALDAQPNAFAFGDLSAQRKSRAVISNAITVNGMNLRQRIAVSGGTYSVNDAAFTGKASLVAPGDSVRVRHVTAAAGNSSVHTTLTIGTVSDTFSSTTAP